MENIAVIFGGKSVEHDISIITALQVMKAFPKGYNMIPLYVRIDGIMVNGENLSDEKLYLNYAKNVKNERKVFFRVGSPFVYFQGKGKIKETIKIDGAVLCNHGNGGEDGSLQGLLELCNIPYTSPGVASSAVCMDKVLTKTVLLENDLPTPLCLYFKRCEYEQMNNEIKQKIASELSFPCIVKPARCGSSVGISICEYPEKLDECIKGALLYDDKVIVEEFIENAREFFCAVVSVDGTLLTSKIDEASKDKFYTFEEKYLEQKKRKEVKVDKALTDKVKQMAKCAYKCLECAGVVRVDFLMSKDGQLYVNEVNTIPGSLAFNLFESKFSDLLHSLIINAQKRNDRRIVYRFNSQAIERYIEMGKSGKLQK
ncbi:MAG: D-alanine--D-alanine ligase [Clostridiales bacterium]|nr:D-alanine--D-alanine ligase [Clostridiales bacterium]